MNEIYVCCYCGCEDIEERAWAKTNGSKFVSFDENSSGYWCPKCVDFYQEAMLTLDEYQEKKLGEEA